MAAMTLVQLAVLFGMSPVTHPVAFGLLLMWLSFELYAAALWVINTL